MADNASRVSLPVNSFILLSSLYIKRFKTKNVGENTLIFLSRRLLNTIAALFLILYVIDRRTNLTIIDVITMTTLLATILVSEYILRAKGVYS